MHKGEQAKKLTPTQTKWPRVVLAVVLIVTGATGGRSQPNTRQDNQAQIVAHGDSLLTGTQSNPSPQTNRAKISQVGRDTVNVSGPNWTREIIIPESCHGTVYAEIDVLVEARLDSGKVMPLRAGPSYQQDHWPNIRGGAFRFRAMSTDQHGSVKMVWEPD